MSAPTSNSAVINQHAPAVGVIGARNKEPPRKVRSIVQLFFSRISDVTYVKALASEPLSEEGFVTLTATAPAGRAGDVARMDVELFTITPVAGVPPNVTVAPFAKLTPVMPATLPPARPPVFGVTLVTTGVVDGATYVNALSNVAS